MSREAMQVRDASASYRAQTGAQDVPPGYKRTEVGVIPEDWQTLTLGSMTVLMTNGFVGTATRHYDSSENGILYIQGYNVEENSFNFHGVKFVTESFHRANTKFCLRGGDLLTVQTGDVGLTTIVPEALAGSNCHALIISRFDHKKIFPLFISYYLNSNPGRSRLKLIETGTTMKHLNVGDMLQFVVPVPPSKVEQRAIADALSDVDGLLTALEALIAKKRAIKQAAMQQLLTGKTRLPRFNGKWEVISMAKHASLKARIGWQALTTGEYLDSGSYYLVTGTDFLNGQVNWSTCHFVDEWRYSQDRNIQLNNGDVLLTKDGTIGKVGYVDNLPGPATLNSGVFVVRPLDNSFVPLFLFYVLSSRIFDDFLSKITAGSTITHLYQKDFITFEFLAPKIEEQTAIATVLSDMDAEIAALEARRDKTRAIKQGMMQQLLTGRVRLVEAKGNEV